MARKAKRTKAPERRLRQLWIKRTAYCRHADSVGETPGGIGAAGMERPVVVEDFGGLLCDVKRGSNKCGLRSTWATRADLLRGHHVTEVFHGNVGQLSPRAGGLIVGAPRSPSLPRARFG